MKKSKFVLCLPLAVGFFLLFQVHTKAEIRFVDQEITTTEQEPEKKPVASETTILHNNGEELNTAQKEVLDELIQKAKEGKTAAEKAETNQTERGVIYVTTNGSKGKIKMTLNGKELTEEEHNSITEKGKAEGKKQTYFFTNSSTTTKGRIIINGKEYSADELVQEGLTDSGVTTSYSFTFEGDPLTEDVKKAIESSRKEMEASRKDMEKSRKDMEASRKDMEKSWKEKEKSRKDMEASRKEMEKSRKDMEASRKDMEKSWKEKEKSRKQELEKIKDKLIIYNGKEMSLEELEKISPNGLGGGNIKIYSTEESIEKYGEKGKNGVIVVTSGSNSGKKATKQSFSITSMQEGEGELLYVIDGKRIKPSELSTIQSEEIESMNVLKGEMAKEKYGKEGENGVIEITKKK